MNKIRYMNTFGWRLFILKTIRRLLLNHNSRLSWYVNECNEKAVENYLIETLNKTARSIDMEQYLRVVNRNVPKQAIWVMWYQGIQNAPEIGFINPTSLNTLRFVTATDKFGCYKILSCILRMGVGNSITDNLCTGGIACAVDLSSGKLINNAKDVIGNMYVEHPTSRVKFDGYQIPYFDECLNLIDVLCKRMPNARYVGWDIAISTNGVCVIEGNTPPSEETTEFSLKGQWYDLLKILND